ncbi:MAG: hypothetical protein DME43_01445 [Verrucomicrobia bacterium]|nr:MAG: hypothetical protein DME43_01445 [Verrucomicrobiota bacterium]PYK72643.1 MAG: hypothetical protein DME44_03955 [Verrucomicrobiota bacterium]
MYIYRKDAEKLFRDTIRGLVGDLRQKGDVLHGLLKQDDWSFVIKAHALLEAAVTQLLIANIGGESLARFIERLPLGGQFGKIKLCEELALLSNPQRKFIRWLSELRNPLVHRLENVTFTFAKHVRRFTNDQARSWANSIVWFSDDDLETQRWWKAIAMKLPKHALFMGLYLVIGECIIHSHHAKAKDAIRETSDVTMKSMFPAYKGPGLKAFADFKKVLQTALTEAEQDTAKHEPSRSKRNRKPATRRTSSRSV